MATKESDWFEIFDEIILLQKYWMELNEILIKSSPPKLYLLTPSNFQQGYYIVIHNNVLSLSHRKTHFLQL
jgi:hypothetical protein